MDPCWKANSRRLVLDFVELFTFPSFRIHVMSVCRQIIIFGDPVYSCSLDSGCMTGGHCFQITGDVCSIFSDCNNLNISFLPVNTYCIPTYIKYICTYSVCIDSTTCIQRSWKGQSRPDVTRPDQTRPDQSGPDQSISGPTSPQQHRSDQIKLDQSKPDQARSDQNG
jgi:hypothetical protein